LDFLTVVFVNVRINFSIIVAYFTDIVYQQLIRIDSCLTPRSLKIPSVYRNWCNYGINIKANFQFTALQYQSVFRSSCWSYSFI